MLYVKDDTGILATSFTTLNIAEESTEFEYV